MRLFVFLFTVLLLLPVDGFAKVEQARVSSKSKAKKKKVDLSPAEKERMVYKRTIEGIKEGTVAWIYIDIMSKNYEKKATELENAASRAKKARKKKGSERLSKVERQHQWYVDMTDILKLLTDRRKTLVNAKHRDPLLPPLDTAKAEKEYWWLVEKFDEIRADNPSRKKSKKKKKRSSE